MKSEARNMHGTWGRFGIVKVVPPAAKKNSITRTATYIQAAKEADRGIGSVKIGDAATASLFGIWDELLCFRHGLA